MSKRDFYEMTLRDLLVHANPDVQAVARHMAYRLNLDAFGVDQPTFAEVPLNLVPQREPRTFQPPAF